MLTVQRLCPPIASGSAFVPSGFHGQSTLHLIRSYNVVAMMKQTDVQACAEQLRALLDEIDADRLDASPVQVAYMRGALEALETMRRQAKTQAGRRTGRSLRCCC
jgi:hypothetical protein